MVLTKEQVLRDLNELSEIKYQKFSSKLTPDTKYKVIGVRVPNLRKLAKKYQNLDVSNYLKETAFLSLEECQLYGMILNNQKFDFYTLKPYLERYVSKIDSWASCDIFCAELKIRTGEEELFWEFIDSYIYKEEEFVVRFGIVMVLEHYIKYENLPRIIRIIENVKTPKYYVQMAIAWLISVCFIKYPDYMLEYLKGSKNLDKFTYNKALSKITDSYRVSEENKKIIRNMHIK